MASRTVLAVDLGAESGRVMAVQLEGGRLQVQELHRFANPVTTIRGTLYWDMLHLWRNIQQGIELGKGLTPASLGVDTWAVDFGLLDPGGNLLGNVVQYRDSRTDGMMEAVFARVPRRKVFAQTGIQFMQLNTLYQMMSLVLRQSAQLKAASTFLTVPDLLNYWLTGTKVCEFTNATTTQMFNPLTGRWAGDMLERLGIPTHILPEIVQPGTRLGSYDNIPVIAPATHDTGSAVAGVPAAGADYAYISSGTWSLVGLEVEQAVLSDAAYEANTTNEGGVYGTYRLLKNVMGLWILQQCRATWAAAGEEYSYADLIKLAEEAAPMRSVFDVNDNRFLTLGDHPARIRAWCAEHGEPEPETPGQIARAVLESLALKYRDIVQDLCAIANREITTIHIVGGGSQNDLLNQFTADACSRPVIAGPVEATVIGNAAVQLITLGELRNLDEARQIIRQNFAGKTYTPRNTDLWEAAHQRLQRHLRPA